MVPAAPHHQKIHKKQLNFMRQMLLIDTSNLKERIALSAQRECGRSEGGTLKLHAHWLR